MKDALLRLVGVPKPPVLRRADGPYRARELEGRVAIASPSLAPLVKEQGADVRDAERIDLAVFDGRGQPLRALYDFFHPIAPKLAPNARVVVVADAQTPDPASAAAARGVEGFTRAFAKEIGRRGATANLLYAPRDADAALAGPLRFFASDRSAYVSGQALRLSNARPQEGSLRGQVALVTGAARGLGAAQAKRLEEEGARIVRVDLRGADLALDITAPDAPAKIAEALAGEVDVVVHNAGITRDKTLGKMSPEQWDAVLSVNYEAAMRIDRELLARGLLREGGRVVCISSISGIAGNFGQTNYCASKAALIGYVQAQAAALAPRGITVNAVAPGFIETDIVKTMPLMIREMGRRLNSLSQSGEPRDVAEAVTFLASPGAFAVSGQTLRVCGQALLGA